MLSSIHPLGERSRHNRWGTTATAFVLGAVAGGALLGAMAGGLGYLVTLFVPLSGVGVVVLVVVLLAVSAAADLSRRGRPLPGIHRQVNEDWLSTYRGWVYGFGFGFQLGLGVVTYVATFAVPVMLIIALLTGSPVAGALIGAVFGLFRGAAVLTVSRVNHPQQLNRFHAGMARLATPAHTSSVAAQATVAVVVVVALVVVA
jgi:MFS family permease